MAFFQGNGQRIFFEDSEGNGVPVIMLHGFLMDHTLFDHQVKMLGDSCRTIRFDARAFGQTSWDEKPFSLYDTVEDTIGLLDHLNIHDAIVVGMSQGGYAALRLALNYPKRVRALVLMSTQAGVDDEATKAQFAAMRDTWANHGPVTPLIEGLATALLGNKELPGMENIWQPWLAKWKTLSRNAIVHGMNNLLERDDITHRLHEITHPALVTHGDADMGMPIALGKALADQLPNCKHFVQVHGAAHAANFTHSEPINKALKDFIDYICNETPASRRETYSSAQH